MNTPHTAFLRPSPYHFDFAFVNLIFDAVHSNIDLLLDTIETEPPTGRNT